MRLTEQQLYSVLIQRINEDLKSKGLTTYDIRTKDYIIKSSQYYNMKKVAEGDKNTPRLSNKRMVALCDYLGINLKEIHFVIEDKHK